MIDPIAFDTAAPLAGLERLPQISLPTASMPALNPADQVRFQAAMHPPLETLPTATPAVVTTVALPEHPVAPGDAILQGLERLHTRYREVGAEMDRLSLQSALSPQDLLGLQMHVAQVTLGAQLVGQVASKLEQNIDTLLKSS